MKSTKDPQEKATQKAAKKAKKEAVKAQKKAFHKPLKETLLPACLFKNIPASIWI